VLAGAALAGYLVLRPIAEAPAGGAAAAVPAPAPL
jgi:hypothetical protein